MYKVIETTLQVMEATLNAQALEEWVLVSAVANPFQTNADQPSFILVLKK